MLLILLINSYLFDFIGFYLFMANGGLSPWPGCSSHGLNPWMPSGYTVQADPSVISFAGLVNDALLSPLAVVAALLLALFCPLRAEKGRGGQCGSLALA